MYDNALVNVRRLAGKEKKQHRLYHNYVAIMVINHDTRTTTVEMKKKMWSEL